MGEQILHIYYQKKYLKKSILLYLLALCVWLGVFFLTIFPLITNRHPNVEELTHIILGMILVFIFAAWAIKFIRIIIECISEYKDAPSIAYSLSNDGISSSRKEWFVSWQDVYNVATLVQNEGYSFQDKHKNRFAIHSWGIDPKDMEYIKNHILKNLPAEKTKRLT